MTNDTRTADDIERDIEEERARMTGTINELQKKFSVEGIVSDLGAMFRGQGGDLGRTISDTVGRNPAALALVGVGLAWLFIGKGRAEPYAGRQSSPDYGSYRDRSAAYGRNPERVNRGGGGTSYEEEDRFWFDDYGFLDGPEPSAEGNAYTGSQGAEGKSSGLSRSLRKGADAVVDAVSNAAAAVRDTAVDLTERLSSGTEDLSEEARTRVLAARRAAHEARIASQAAIKRGGRAATHLFEDQPLVVGALAVAVGAAIGGILPHSRIEDETLGANSDRLFADAQRLFREERNKAMAVAKVAASEAGSALKDTGSDIAELLPEGKSAGDVIGDYVADAAARVTNSAKGEAERQGLLGERRS